MKSTGNSKKRNRESNSSRKELQMRQRLAAEAARILALEGARNYHSAKLKAAERLGASDTRNLPSNEEIETSLIAYQTLFHKDEQTVFLSRLLNIALEVMVVLEPFSPRLVGSLAKGTATRYSDINLHLFADTTEEVAWLLLEKRIPFDVTSKRFIVNGNKPSEFPVYRFVAADITIEAVVFPLNGLRQTPRSTVDGEPILRATIKTVTALLAEQNDADISDHDA